MRYSRISVIFILFSLALSTAVYWEFPESSSCSATEVSGMVWGTWTLSNSPYYLQDNITIPYGQTLVIEPGVYVIANASYKILVAGRLFANGSAYEWIYFHGNYSSPKEYTWLGIEFNQTGTGIIQNCSISDAELGVHLNGSNNVSSQDINNRRYNK